MVGGLGLAMLVIMVIWIKDKPTNALKLEPIHHIKVFSIAKRAYLNTQTLRAAFYTSLMNMAVAVFGAMMGSLYMMQRLDVGKEDAAMINSMLFFGAIVGGPLIGWWSDRLGLRVLPMKIGALASLLTVLIILYAPVSLGLMAILFFLLGFFTAAQVVSYPLVAESSPSTMTATVVSTVSILTQGGYIVYQNMFSLLLLWHGDMRIVNGTPVYSLSDYQSAAMILPLGLIMALGLILGLKETHCRQTITE
jgi:MFS family permease